jgi:hypothetical protein
LPTRATGAAQVNLPAAFASLAQSMASALGAPFYAGKIIIDGTPGGYDDDGVFQPGGDPTEIDCQCQIDDATEYMRANEGFADGEVRFVILRAGLGTDPTTDAKIKVLAGPKAGTWLLSSLSLDPAGIGWTGKGRRSA